MADVDVEKIRGLAESAERRAEELHARHSTLQDRAHGQTDIEGRDTLKQAASVLNDFFYWSGYKNAYRGIIAMVELNEGIEKEMDAEGSCP